MRAITIADALRLVSREPRVLIVDHPPLMVAVAEAGIPARMIHLSSDPCAYEDRLIPCEELAFRLGRRHDRELSFDLDPPKGGGWSETGRYFRTLKRANRVRRWISDRAPLTLFGQSPLLDTSARGVLVLGSQPGTGSGGNQGP